MNIKRIFTSFLLLQIFCFSTLLWGQKKISILGDSYSTFGGYMSPATNLCWYNGPDGSGRGMVNDVVRVEQTWWHLLMQEKGYVLERNNSYSGSTVCCTGYRKKDYSDRAFITRIHNLGNPDIILVFGGTNDAWAGSPMGEFCYQDWDKASLYDFRPAFAYLLHHLQALYPHATIYNITNSALSNKVTSSMAEICLHYGVQNIQLHDIDKQSSHPSEEGMRSICQQVGAVLEAAGE